MSRKTQAKRPRRPNRAHKSAKRRAIWPVTAIILFAAGAFGINLVASPDAGAQTPVEVWKSPSCGCCGKWISHLEANGFDVTVHNRRDMETVKNRMEIKQEHRSCHTAKVGDYVIEGHVPAGDIRTLLAEQPRIRGLSVPGMPMGSPGMEGSVRQPYKVITMAAPGDVSRTFAHH